MIVYHYCSFDVFDKIITNKEIRLTDITKSNDPNEIIWISQFIEEIFIDEYNNENSKYFKENLSLEDFKYLLKTEKDSFFKDKKNFNFFVCCFSAEKDLLSQWRGYADDGKGVAIGFDTSLITNTSFDFFYKFEKVEYAKVHQMKYIRDMAKKLIKKIKGIIKNDDMDYSDIIMAFDDVYLDIFEQSIFMKSDFYKEENEYRISLSLIADPDIFYNEHKLNDNFSISEMRYYINKNNQFTKYFNLIFKNSKKFIREVILGPKNNSDIDEIQYILNLNNIDCVVKKSSGYYR